MSIHKRIQPIRSSRLVGQREHTHECLALLYRLFFYDKADVSGGKIVDNPCSWDGSVREDTNLRERDILLLRCINVEVNL